MLQAPAPAPADAGTASSAPQLHVDDPVLQEMALALETNSFKMQGKIGDRWYAALKKDPELRKNYANSTLEPRKKWDLQINFRKT